MYAPHLSQPIDQFINLISIDQPTRAASPASQVPLRPSQVPLWLLLRHLPRLKMLELSLSRPLHPPELSLEHGQSIAMSLAWL